MRSYLFVLLLLLTAATSSAQTEIDPEVHLKGSIPAFTIASSDLTLSRLAQPDTYFDKTGRRFAMLGTESGAFEAWAYPIKLFRDFSFSFFIGSSTEPIRARDIVSRIDVRPSVTTITYVFQSFTVHAHYIASIEEPGAVILLDVDSTEPLTVVAGFIPTLSPMWPGGIGGQYAYWDEAKSAYLISESSYENHGYVGSPAAAGMSYTPAHMLSDHPNQFSIRIEDPSSVVDRLIPILMAGGTGERTAAAAAYDKLALDPASVYLEAKRHFEHLRTQTLRIDTPVKSLNLALEWGKIAYDNLLVSNPHMEGTGLVAGLDRSGSGGRPGFGWFFGGDTYINAFSLNALGYHEAAREAIAFMSQFQREDGKMAHEISQSTNYVDWFGDYPYAYIHADTSPFFIVAVADYYEATGDLEFVRSQFPAIRRAYSWSRATDGNGDGLMDNGLAGLGALEFGALTGIQSDIYLNAAWLEATASMAYLASVFGEDALAEQARTDHDRARASFEKYWSPNAEQYVYAFNEDGNLVEEITPWSAVGLMFSYGSDERARKSLLRMARADLATDWGVRMLSTKSAYFEPLNYNYGAVWPFLTSWVTTAQYRRGLPLQAFSGLMSTVQHVFNRSLGQVTEVFSGIRHTWPQESVPHQGFCTAGTILPLVRGLLGLSSQNGAATLVFRPSLPGSWKRVGIENFKMGRGSVDVTVDRSASLMRTTFSSNRDDVVELVFEPVFAPGTQIRAVRLNGLDHPFEVNASSLLTKLRVTARLEDHLVVEADLVPAFEILSPVWESQVGDESTGLRINRFDAEDRTATLLVEGIPGRTYRLETLLSERVSEVEGATMDSSTLVINIPRGRDGEYVQHEVRIRFRDS